MIQTGGGDSASPSRTRNSLGFSLTVTGQEFLKESLRDSVSVV
jgi:hypothetical protein